MKPPESDMPGPAIEHDRRLAVALEYTGHGAPRVTAQGHGALAEEIIRLAQTHDIPLYPNRDLVQVLAQIELDQEIPELLYHAVAELIAFAYMVRGKVPEGFQARPATTSDAAENPFGQ